MIGALLYLRINSLRNLVAYRLRRLRQPKYLLGAVVAAAYIYYFFLRRLSFAGAPQGPAPVMADAGRVVAAFLCTAAAGAALVRIAFAWIAPSEKPGLRFSEAEIAFLFPAPVTRQTLVHFRLLSAQAAILLTSALIVFFFRRMGDVGGGRVASWIGWWVILSTFDLHVTGTNLTLARLRERGRGFVLWRILAVAAIVSYAAAVVLCAVAYLDAHSASFLAGSGPGAMGRAIGAMAASSPLRWLIAPFGVVFAPYFARSPADFALAIVPALAVVALHYFWVARTEVRFEEGSIALAERRAAARAALQRGEAPAPAGARPKPLAGPFPLEPAGLPETALLWKNLLSMRSSLLNRRTVALSLWVFVCALMVARTLLADSARARGGDIYGPIVVTLCFIVAGYTLLVGPQIARQDLRADLPNMDILKTYPVEGWRLALGELLAPTAILTAVLWACIIVCAFAFDSRGDIEGLTPAVRVSAALCLGAAAPFLCLLQLIVPNMVMVLMPGWYQATRSRGGGIELMGQRLILGVGQLLLALLVAVPAALVAVIVLVSAGWWFGSPAPALFAALVAVLSIMASELVVALWWLGDRLAAFDVSADSR
jgi:hypothetical protein